MAEVGVTSALLTLSVFAFKTSKSLYEAVSSFKSRRRKILDIQEELKSLVDILGKITEQAQRPGEGEKLEPLRSPLKCCTVTCQEMSEMLEEAKRRSKDGSDSAWVWLKMRYREKDFEDTRSRLAGYKSTLGIAFQLVDSRNHLTIQGSLDDLKNVISSTREDLEDQLDQVRNTISTANASIRQILQDDQTLLQESLASLAQAERAAQTILPTIIIEGNQYGPGSRVLFGTDTSQPQFNLTVSNNTAAINSVASSGVYTPETLQALLGNSSRSTSATGRPHHNARAIQQVRSVPRIVSGGREMELVIDAPWHTENIDEPENVSFIAASFR